MAFTPPILGGPEGTRQVVSGHRAGNVADVSTDFTVAPSPLSAVPVSAPPQQPLGRIPVGDVRPCVDHGSRPAKSVVGEPFTVTAEVFREGHDAVSATLVLTAPDGGERHLPMVCTNPGLSIWQGEAVADREGLWSYRVEGWSNPWATWVHDASIKIPADIDPELMRAEGVIVLDRAAQDPNRDEGGAPPFAPLQRSCGTCRATRPPRPCTW